MPAKTIVAHCLAPGFVLAATLVGYFAAASVVQATFGCEVGFTPDGYTRLYREPDETSAVIRRLPDGSFVSLLDDVDTRSERWAAVAHSLDQNAFWGAGDKGWVLAAHLDECG
jgi:hypothetical protein